MIEMMMNRWQRAILVLVVAFGAVLGSAVQPVAAQSITTGSRLANGAVGSAYSQTLSVSGGAAPYKWYVIAGSLPAGLSLGQTTGVISGTPTTAVAGSFSVAVTDARSSNGYANFNLTVTAPAAAPSAPAAPSAALSISTGTQLPNATTSAAYSTTLLATGGRTPYRWVVMMGSLPAGLSLNQSTGVISGTPTTAVAGTFSVAVTDANSNNAYANLKLTVTGASAPPPAANVAISTGTQLPAGTVNSTYSTTLAATGGTTPYRWQVTAGSLPAGLGLNTSTGVISGTPTTAVAGSFTITATDAASRSASATFSLTVNSAAASSGPLSVTSPTQLPNATTSVAYSTTLIATGGRIPYRWVVIAGTLPAGLALNQTTGVISGTPTTAVAGTFSVAVTDAASSNAYANHKLTVTGASAPPPAAGLAISSGTQLPAGTVNVAYSTTLRATGGTTPYRWQVTAGTLPAGLTLNQTTGVISGTPTSAVAGAFTVAVTDASSTNVYANLSLTISAAGNGWSLIWSDEFNGPNIDRSVWANEMGFVRNGELQAYTSDSANQFLNNGDLVLKANYVGGSGQGAYTSASLTTKGLKTFLYGKIQARIKTPSPTGSWPAFWMLPARGGWPQNGEIDILENVSQEANVAYGTVHYNSGGSHAYFLNRTVLGASLANDYHVYEIQWTPTSIDWFLDDVKYGHLDITGAIDNSAFTGYPFYMILNYAIGGSWAEAPNPAQYPGEMRVDYVRYYQKQ